MKKFFRKRWVRTLCIILASVFCCAIVSNLTNGFTEKIDLTLKLNEDNYFFELIEDGDIYSSIDLDAVADNGIITFNGDIPRTDIETLTSYANIKIATIELEPGTYTFSCFNDEEPSWKTYMAIASYSEGGKTYTVHADFDKAPNNSSKDATKLGQTFTLEEKTTVTFKIDIKEGAKLDNVKAIPVLVEGEKVGSYYNYTLFG